MKDRNFIMRMKLDFEKQKLKYIETDIVPNYHGV